MPCFVPIVSCFREQNYVFRAFSIGFGAIVVRSGLSLVVLILSVAWVAETGFGDGPAGCWNLGTCLRLPIAYKHVQKLYAIVAYELDRAFWIGFGSIQSLPGLV